MKGVVGKQRTVVVAMMAAAATLALVASTCLAMSIETEPVKVTHRNSGPRYELAAENEVERTRMTSPEESQPEQPQQPPMGPPSAAGGEQESSGEPTPIGHVAIRRIYLFPMMTRGHPSDWSSGERNSESEQQAPARGGDQEMPSMFAKPFWPFLTPARPSPAAHHDQPTVHRPHLFGADEASRSPGSADQDKAASGEQEHRHHQLDPIQMMLDMMHQAIAAQMVPQPSEPSRDEKVSSSDNAPAESSSDERPKMPGSEMARPAAKPMAQNETSEDIVEIEGKKYLRKTVVNRHIGENIIFMTKRLIFVPLNETDSTAPTTETVATTTTDSSASTSTTTAAASPAVEDSSSIPDRVGENKPTTTTTLSPTEVPAVTSTTTTTTTEKTASEEPAVITAKSEPLSTIAPSASTDQAPTTTVVSTEMAAESTTTTKPTETFVERVAEVLEKATERMVEEIKPASTSTTEAPATSSDKPQ